MTNTVNLEKIWAETGGYTDPGDSKYALGWVAEKPTFQAFNYVLQATSKNILSFAEHDIFPWQEGIAYEAGARVQKNGRVYSCITAHTGVSPDIHSPSSDNTNSYWVNGTIFSSNDSPFEDLKQELGVYVYNVGGFDATNLWNRNDLTIKNGNALIGLYCIGGTQSHQGGFTQLPNKNLLFGNVDGELVVVDVGDTDLPDGTTQLIPSSANQSYKIYHEGNKPSLDDITNAVEEAPQDGKLYARQNGNWVEITNTHVSEAPPPAVEGKGTKWYNLEDATMYVDIDDGDSSQWVPASPPNAFDVKTPMAETGADLADITSAINIHPKKRPNYSVLDLSTQRPVWATGSSDSSAWVYADGYIAYTPT
tara:strand:+ start:1614 stop:2708 length:1095 start_codon:yes stop_codon:yes gene_type:complete